MSITIHWWHVPTLLTVALFAWGLWPQKYQSSMWGDIENFFFWMGGLVVVLASWAIAGVFFK